MITFILKLIISQSHLYLSLFLCSNSTHSSILMSFILLRTKKEQSFLSDCPFPLYPYIRRLVIRLSFSLPCYHLVQFCCIHIFAYSSSIFQTVSAILTIRIPVISIIYSMCVYMLVSNENS